MQIRVMCILSLKQYKIIKYVFNVYCSYSKCTIKKNRYVHLIKYLLHVINHISINIIFTFNIILYDTLAKCIDEHT